MDVFNTYATNPKKEVEGVWRDAPGSGRVLVGRSGNRNYSRLLAALYERNQRELDAKTPEAEDLSDQIMIEVMAETVLLGWEGITFKGRAMTYSKENAKLLLGVKDFRLFIVRLSNEIDGYRAAAEAVVGEA